ncbi:MAG: hypothetical protein V4722_03985 [Bacteroidota bacterium]
MKRIALCCKRLFCVLIFSFLTATSILSQEDMDVEIAGPRMPDMIEKLWLDLPTQCSLKPGNCTIEGSTTDECGLTALKHLRVLITNCQIRNALREAIKFEFKLLKLLPVGKVTGTILDIADLTAKAISADSPESLEGDLVKYGFGKLVGDAMVNKLKKVTDIPDGEAGDVLTNLTKLFYKQVWDKVKSEIFPGTATWECHPATTDCQANIHMSMEGVGDDAVKTIARFIFSADGNCHCKVACSPGTAGPFLGEWNAHGTMDLVVDKAEVIEKGWIFKKKVLRVTLRAERPNYRVTASCCNSKNQDSSNISYDEPTTTDIAYNQAFGGVSLLREDAKPAFYMYGPTVAYTRFFNRQLGAILCASMYFGAKNNMNYTRFLLLIGATFSPFQQYLLGDKVHVFARLLAGLATIKSKYGSMSSYSEKGFGGEIGAGVDIKINKRLVVRPIQLDFQPVKIGDNFSANFKLSAGIALGLAF